MTEPQIAVLIGALIAVALLWGSLRQRRHARLLHDLPTSKTLGVFIGMVELKGTAESAEPLISYLAASECVYYAWTVEEHWSTTTTSTDSKGNTTTSRDSGWKTVAKGGESDPFYLEDEDGFVLIRPEGAKIEAMEIFEEKVTRRDALYYDKGPRAAVSDSDHERRFVEWAIPLHAPLYVVGPARERRDIVAPEIAAQRGAALYLISTRTEESVRSGLGIWSWLWWSLGLIIASVPLGVALFDPSSGWEATPAVGAALLAAYLATWAGAWVWMVYNSIVSLRQRVRQGASLIDVQLKRRHDLIPGIVAVVGGLSSHEREVQETLASLRNQLNATAVGESGPNVAGVAAQLRVVIERYPQLKAQESFANLHKQLVETEQRIALARAYYNDIATQFATRLDSMPDGLVAKLGAMRKEPLLGAADFERAAVTVKLTES